jgi:integration host factor subunit alpha
MTLTKSHIANSINNRLEVPKTKAAHHVESLLEISKRTLESGEDVLVSGFGKFSVKRKHERRGRNPQTGDALKLDSRKVVTFRCSPVLKDKIKGGGEDETM